jgi:MFS family permease
VRKCGRTQEAAGFSPPHARRPEGRRLLHVRTSYNHVINTTRSERIADWLGLNRATLAVLAVIGCLGLSEEIWSNFLSLHLKNQAASADAASAVITAALYMGFISSAKNLLEGFGYIIGGTIAHRMGPRVALAVSAAPMAVGVTLLLISGVPWIISVGALLMTNWEPLSVPATFDVVGSEVPKNRRTIAFAVQSIQKRLPKMIGPAVGAAVIVAVGYWMNLVLALILVGLAVVIQLALTRQMRPKTEPVHIPMREILRTMPPELRQLLRAEIFIRWGDWFARDFAVLYVVAILTQRWGWSEGSATEAAGWLMTLMATTALATYIPMAKWIDRSASPRPFIGTTFLLFSLFPICLVLLPNVAKAAGLPVMAGFVITYIINGLRELGEPARKALITTGFPPEVRARAVGIYWGVRSFAFFPAPIVAALLWSKIGADATFLIGGGIGLAGTILFALRRNAAGNGARGL